MRSRVAICVVRLVALIAVVCIGVPAVAGEDVDPDELFDRLSDEEEQTVIRLIDEGQDAYEGGDFERAIDLFHEVHELFPHPDVTYRLALCYERNNDKEMAIQYYGRFLEQEPDADERGRIERIIAEFEDELGDDISSVRIETNPAGGEVFVGDRDTIPVGHTPEVVTLEPGTHDIYVEKEGYESLSATVEIEEGRDHVVQYQLREADVSESADDEVEPEPRPEPAAGSGGVEWWKPTVSLMMLGLGGLSTYQSFRYRNDVSDYEDQLDALSGAEGDDRDRRERNRLLDEQSTAHDMSIVMGVAAGVAFVSGGIFTGWWLATGGGEDERIAVDVRPHQHGVDFGVSARF